MRESTVFRMNPSPFLQENTLFDPDETSWSWQQLIIWARPISTCCQSPVYKWVVVGSLPSPQRFSECQQCAFALCMCMSSIRERGWRGGGGGLPNLLNFSPRGCTLRSASVAFNLPSFNAPFVAGDRDQQRHDRGACLTKQASSSSW